MTRDDLLTLARTLAESRGVKLSTVSVWATGGMNHLLFDRLSPRAPRAGGSRLTLENGAAAWFRQHWPRGLKWPVGISRYERSGVR